MIALWMLALGTHAFALEPESDEPAETVQVEAPSAVTPPEPRPFVLWIGATVEPVRFESDGYSGSLGAQTWLTKRLALEAAASAYIRPSSPARTSIPRTITQTPLSGRPSDPVWTADLRVQFAIVDGDLNSRRGEIPITLTVDLGGGAMRTTDEPAQVACAPGEPCADKLDQLHPTALVGTGLMLAPSERVRIRGVILYRAWVENLGGAELQRMGSTGVGVDVGVQLGKRSSKFEAPLPPIDPLYENGT